MILHTIAKRRHGILKTVTYPPQLAISPTQQPVHGTISLPGSKSITNRALALAALSEGTTTLTGALFAEDTQRMRDCLQALGFRLDADEAAQTITVEGQGGRIPATEASLFVGNSGTTARFISPLAALGHGNFVIDGVERMRQRPIGDLASALMGLGVAVECPTGCPPLTIHASGLHGGTTTVRADASSQFLSGLLLAAPFAEGDETVIQIEGPILSEPYITMTVKMLAQFGVMGVRVSPDKRTYRISSRQKRDVPSPATYAIEPDASAASYFFAAAALTGGWVRIAGLGPHSLQGDTRFVDVLEQMGCEVVMASGAIDVHGPEQLKGVKIDMNAISDTVMTLAAIAPFADSPTVIENVGHIRHKETDRLSAVATELARLGVQVEERADGLTIYPAQSLNPATIQTYDDHRMAMAFAITGLRSPGIVIDNPACVAKTFPAFFARLEELVRS